MASAGTRCPRATPRIAPSRRRPAACSLAQAEAVPTSAVDVQFRGDARPLEPEIRLGQSFGNVRPVVVGARHERRRRLFGRQDVAGASGIDRPRKSGRDGWRRWRRSRRRCPCRTACRPAPRALRPRKTPSLPGGSGRCSTPRPAPDQPDRPLRVGERVHVNLVGRARFTREPVFEDEGGDAAVAEPFADVVAFVGDGQHAMTAARNHEDRRAGRLVLRGEIRRNARVVDARDAELSAGRGGHRFLRGLPFGSRRAVGPQSNLCRRIGGEEREREQKRGKEWAQFSSGSSNRQRSESQRSARRQRNPNTEKRRNGEAEELRKRKRLFSSPFLRSSVFGFRCLRNLRELRIPRVATSPDECRRATAALRTRS